MTILYSEQFVGGGCFSTKPVFAVDAKYFVVGISRKIKVYSVQTGKIIFSLLGHTNTVTQLVLHPNNDKQVFSCSLDGTVKLWDVDNGVEIKNWNIGVPVKRIAVPKQDKLEFFYIAIDKQIYKVNENMKHKTKILSAKLPIRDMCVSPNNLILCAIEGSNIHIVEIGSKRKVVYKNGVQVNCIAYNPEQELIATGDEKGHIKLWYPQVNEKSKTSAQSIWHWHPVAVNSIEFSVDGNYLYSGGNDGTLVVWFISRTQRKYYYVFSPIKFLAVSPLQDHYICICKNNHLHVIDPAATNNRREEHVSLSISGLITDSSEGDPEVVRKLVVEPINKNILLSGTNILQWYNVNEDSQTYEECIQFKAVQYDPSRFKIGKPLSHLISNITFSSGGEYLLHTEKYGEHYNIKFWNFDQKLKKYNIITVIDTPHTKEITSAVFSPTVTDLCITTSKDGTAKFWKKNEKWFACSAVVKFRDFPANYACFSKDGTVAIIAFENFLTFWQTASATLLHNLAVSKSDSIRRVEFVSQEHFVVQTNSQLYLFSIKSMKLIWTLKFKEIHHLAVNKYKPEFLITVNDRKTIIMLTTSDTPLQYVFNLQKDAHVDVIDYLNEDEIVYLDNLHELYIISNNEKQQLKDSEKEEQQEMQIEESIDISAEDIRAKLLKDVVTENKKQQPLDDTILHSFDPDKGVGAWKDLFNTTAHALASMSNLYPSYMDCFLLKKKLPKPKKEVSEKSNVIPTTSIPLGGIEKKKKKKIKIMDDDMQTFLKSFGQQLTI